MKMNPEMKRELNRLSELSAQLKDEEKLWGEQCTARWTAVERGAGPDVVRKHSEQIINTVNRIAHIKNTIVERVHVLAAPTDAQTNADDKALSREAWKLIKDDPRVYELRTEILECAGDLVEIAAEKLRAED